MIDQRKFAFFEIATLFVGIAGCILIKIDLKQPKPYMDEIFHVPQAQQYCKGEFLEWDPMITTLPGLYMTSVIVMQPVSWLFDIPIKSICTSFWLRSINIGFACGNLGILVLLLLKLHKGKDPVKCIVTATSLSLLPVLYFFTFLYYTDPGSVFFVLLTYLLCLHEQHTMAASAGSVAIFFRQTNIVWVAFAAMLIISKHLTEFVMSENKDIDPRSGIEKEARFVIVILKQLLLSSKLKQIIKLAVKVFQETWTYIVVGLSFIAFMVLNGGIVVGAKNDHQAGLHFPQLFYFSAFCSVFSFMLFISLERIKGFSRFLYKKPLLVVFLTAVSFFLIWKYTFAHRYLLADNRHYTFYIWSKIYRRHENIKYILIPAYLFATWNILYSLKEKNILWTISFVVCLTINLVPSMLLEFRYFIIPYIVWRLNSPLPSYWKLTVEIIYNIGINILTLYIFMDRPFTWDHDGSTQRFMW